ncbi:BING4, C-terminal domain-containing protein, partial [Cynara cardunculus var. scolymus]
MEIQDISDDIDVKVKKYQRGEGADLEALKDKKLKGQLANREELYKKSANAAAKAEKWLMQTEAGRLESEGFEKTWRFSQQSIAQEVDVSSRKNQFDLVLPDLGPYTIDYTSSGRYMVTAGRKGHLAIMDLHTMKPVKDFQVRETVRDVVFLHNETFFAAAQKNVVASGHSGGTISMWKPTSAAPLVKMLCHHGPVTAIAFHPNGHLMATAGMDKKLKIWDLRKYEVLQTLPGHAKSLDFSQKGLLASSTGSFVQILANSSDSQNYDRYMIHTMVKGYQIQKCLFRPYEDVLGIGHSMGLSSILVPGSGEPNFDSWVANPFETLKQRREKEVRLLLDKLPPESIIMDPTKIGTLRTSNKIQKATKEEKEAEKAAAIAAAKSGPQKKKTKGRSKPSKVAKKKQEGVEKAKRPFAEENKHAEMVVSKKKQKRITEANELPKSLQPFVSRKA